MGSSGMLESSFRRAAYVAKLLQYSPFYSCSLLVHFSRSTPIPGCKHSYLSPYVSEQLMHSINNSLTSSYVQIVWNTVSAGCLSIIEFLACLSIPITVIFPISPVLPHVMFLSSYPVQSCVQHPVIYHLHHFLFHF